MTYLTYLILEKKIDKIFDKYLCSFFNTPINEGDIIFGITDNTLKIGFPLIGDIANIKHNIDIFISKKLKDFIQSNRKYILKNMLNEGRLVVNIANDQEISTLSLYGEEDEIYFEDLTEDEQKNYTNINLKLDILERHFDKNPIVGEFEMLKKSILPPPSHDINSLIQAYQENDMKYKTIEKEKQQAHREYITEFDKYKRIQMMINCTEIRFEMIEWLKQQNKCLNYIPILESDIEIYIDNDEIIRLREENKLKDHELYGWVFEFKEYKINKINFDYSVKMKDKKLKEKKLLLKTPQKLWIYILKTYPKDILLHLGTTYDMYTYHIKIPGKDMLEKIMGCSNFVFFYKGYSGRILSQKRTTDGMASNDPYSIEI